MRCTLHVHPEKVSVHLHEMKRQMEWILQMQRLVELQKNSGFGCWRLDMGKLSVVVLECSCQSHLQRVYTVQMRMHMVQAGVYPTVVQEQTSCHRRETHEKSCECECVMRVWAA